MDMNFAKRISVKNDSENVGNMIQKAQIFDTKDKSKCKSAKKQVSRLH